MPLPPTASRLVEVGKSLDSRKTRSALPSGATRILQPSSRSYAPTEVDTVVRFPYEAFAETVRDVNSPVSDMPARSQRPSAYGKSPPASSRQASPRGAPAASSSNGRFPSSTNGSWEMPATPSARSAPTQPSQDSPLLPTIDDGASGYQEPLSFIEEQEQPLARRRRVPPPERDERMRDEGVTPSPVGRMMVSFSMDDYRRHIEAMNSQFTQAHTLGQEQATQQFEQVIHQVKDYLALVFREGQQKHDLARRLQRKNSMLRVTLLERAARID